jgi:hypothetical protein
MITKFDVPGAGPFGTMPSSISPEGVITGADLDTNFAFHGFARIASGAIATFDEPNAGTGFFQGTNPVTLNVQDAIVGCYTDTSNASFAFVRFSNGVYSSLTPLEILALSEVYFSPACPSSPSGRVRSPLIL